MKGHPGPARGLSHGNRIINSETCLLVNQSQEQIKATPSQVDVITVNMSIINPKKGIF